MISINCHCGWHIPYVQLILKDKPCFNLRSLSVNVYILVRAILRVETLRIHLLNSRTGFRTVLVRLFCFRKSWLFFSFVYQVRVFVLFRFRRLSTTAANTALIRWSDQAWTNHGPRTFPRTLFLYARAKAVRISHLAVTRDEWRFSRSEFGSRFIFLILDRFHKPRSRPRTSLDMPERGGRRFSYLILGVKVVKTLLKINSYCLYYKKIQKPYTLL